MSLFKKITLLIRYRKKHFKKLGTNVSYQEMNSKFLFTENISIGEHCKILDGAHIDGSGGISIGKGTIIAPLCTILTSNHFYDEDHLEYLPYDHRMIKKPVSIGDYCWIGRNVMIMPGVKIGDGCVIAAGSIVVKDIPSYSVAGGNPARIIKNRKGEKIEKLIKEGRSYNDPSVNTDMRKRYITSL